MKTGDFISRTMQFEAGQAHKSWLQILTSFGGLIAACGIMYWGLNETSWSVLMLSPLAAGFIVKIFIIQHDCGHGSFFESGRLNTLVGLLCSLITVTPYNFWKRQHAKHHGFWNNLNRRASSDIDVYSSCLTDREYGSLSNWRKIFVRISRHPIVANALLPPFIFVFVFRVPFDANSKTWRRERGALYLTNVALIAVYSGLCAIFGYRNAAIVHLINITLASIIGIWLFTVQHRFENACWATETSWRFAEASMKSASYLRLPRILQWFTGNIGFHHVHHTNARIPNYRLEECHWSIAEFQEISELSFSDAFRGLKFTVWSIEQGRLVTFRAAQSRLLDDRSI